MRNWTEETRNTWRAKRETKLAQLIGNANAGDLLSESATPRERRLFSLYYSEAKTLKEIGSEVGMSYIGVHNSLRRLDNLLANRAKRKSLVTDKLLKELKDDNKNVVVRESDCGGL